MAKRKGLKGLIIFIIIVGIVFGGGYYALKTTRSVGVAWSEADYQSYTAKVQRKAAMNGAYNLINLSKGKITTKGKLDLNIALTSAEVSSALSKENKDLGPIRDVKVNFLGGNEAEATFKLAPNFTQYASLDKYGILNNKIVKSALSGTPLYVRLKIDKTSPKSVTADIQNLSVGRIALPANVIDKVESEAIRAVNDIMVKYDNFSMESLSIDSGKLNFKGSIPEEVTVN